MKKRYTSKDISLISKIKCRKNVRYCTLNLKGNLVEVKKEEDIFVYPIAFNFWQRIGWWSKEEKLKIQGRVKKIKNMQFKIRSHC